MKAISSGLFPIFVSQDDVNAEKDLAQATCACGDGDIEDIRYYVVENADRKTPAPTIIRPTSLIGALNGLSLSGYRTHEAQLDDHDAFGSTVTFSRRRHSSIVSSATDMFIPSNDEIIKQRQSKYLKQLVMIATEQPMTLSTMYAPASFSEDVHVRENHYGSAKIDMEKPNWLHMNNFLTREEGIEKVFENYINLFTHQRYHEGCRIFSRIVQLEQNTST